MGFPRERGFHPLPMFFEGLGALLLSCLQEGGFCLTWFLGVSGWKCVVWHACVPMSVSVCTLELPVDQSSGASSLAEYL